MGVTALKRQPANGHAALPKSLTFDPVLYQQLQSVKEGRISGPTMDGLKVGERRADAYLQKFRKEFSDYRQGKEPEKIEDILLTYRVAQQVVWGKLPPFSFSVGNTDFTPAVARKYIEEHRQEVEAHLRELKQQRNGFSRAKPPSEGIRR